MADLTPYLTSDIPARIYRHHETHASDWRRSHLGASLIGDDCERKLWYTFRWVKAPNHRGQLLRLFESGNLAEKRLIVELMNIGINVHSMQAWVNIIPHFSGSIDSEGEGFTESPKKTHVIEFKTHNQKSFDALVKDGVQKSKPLHYAQMTIYMYGRKTDRAYYIAVNKNDDSLYAERIKLDEQYAEQLIAKAKRIINAPEPMAGISQNPAWYQCKMCDYHDVCHGKAKIEVNCRTCCRATPEPDGSWTCVGSGKVLCDEAQRRGCGHHIFIPSVIGEVPVDTGEDWIKYETWTNGWAHTRSVDKPAPMR